MGTVTDIKIAKRTGFCYGVREAIDKAKEASAAGKSTHTLGQVVHNEGVVNDLQALGIQTVDTLDDVDHGAAVVIRAHGVRPEVMERDESRGGHTREDFPAMDPAWRQVNLVCALRNGEVAITRQPVPVMRPELLRLFDRAELAKYMTEAELSGVDAPGEDEQ